MASTSSQQLVRTPSSNCEELVDQVEIGAPKVPSKSRRKAVPRKRGPKVDKGKALDMEEPLSMIARRFPQVKIRNMESFVNRSKEVRLAEVERAGGKVRRPMNNFILYRSAYSDLTKVWLASERPDFAKDNHQNISGFTGRSWGLETDECKIIFSRLAARERENHSKAHPDYKFEPNKGPVQKRKLDGEGIGENDEIELQEYIEPNGTNTRAGSGPSTRRRLNGGSADPIIHRDQRPLLVPSRGLERSSYEANNPGRLAPPPLNAGVATDHRGARYMPFNASNSAGNISNQMMQSSYQELTNDVSSSTADQSISSDKWNPYYNSGSRSTDESKIDPSLLNLEISRHAALVQQANQQPVQPQLIDYQEFMNAMMSQQPLDFSLEGLQRLPAYDPSMQIALENDLQPWETHESPEFLQPNFNLSQWVEEETWKADQ
jgi:hypothetical protein